MEKDLFFNMVQGEIGYTFKNKDLLLQAFTRRSYAGENGGEDNEILEFIGDKALDIAIVKLLVSKYGRMKNGESADGIKIGPYKREAMIRKGEIVDTPVNSFVCSVDEGELTEIKSRMVQKKTLAQRVEDLGLAQFLLIGNSDEKNGALESPSVKEDLFEAIVGAVTLDCGWDFDEICRVVDAMILPEDFFLHDADDNYVRMIYDLEAQEGLKLWFWFDNQGYTSTWYHKPEGIIQQFPLEYNFSRLKCHCMLKYRDDLPIFHGYGASKSEARMNVCKLAFEYLQKEGYIRDFTIGDEIADPNREDSIGQLEILARRGYFSLPTYDFTQEYDPNGNPVWTCKCSVKELEKQFAAVSSSKKDAKKTVAYEMLLFALNKEVR